jgi:hypothetical protein
LISIFDLIFKDLSKGLIEIAYSLNHSKDMRDIFVDLLEKIIEPCKENEWKTSDVKFFLEEYQMRGHQLDDINRFSKLIFFILFYNSTNDSLITFILIEIIQNV